MDIKTLLKKEQNRQTEGIELIPSENIMFPECREILSSVLTNKYSEGYPKKRYYAGNSVIDDIETIAIERVKKLFGTPHVNVQAHSGSPANLAISLALAGVGGKMVSQHLNQGGHLSMGQEASYTSQIFNVKHYRLTKNGEVDWKDLKNVTTSFRPAIIWSGGTAYTKKFNFKKYAEIADETNAYFVADISHVGGLVAGGVHPSPVKYADVIMTTTHKTLRGPWGAIIAVTKKGLEKDPELRKKIDRAVFPGLQGGPHMANIASIAEMARLASTDKFKAYSKQVVNNAKQIASILKEKEYDLVGGGTQNHMVWIDLRSKRIEGWTAHVGLQEAGLYINKQTIPHDPRSAYYPSGIRLGTPTMTTRGMKLRQATLVANLIDEGIEIIVKITKNHPDIGSGDWDKDQKARKEYKMAVKDNKELKELSKRVKKLCIKFPI